MIMKDTWRDVLITLLFCFGVIAMTFDSKEFNIIGIPQLIGVGMIALACLVDIARRKKT